MEFCDRDTLGRFMESCDYASACMLEIPTHAHAITLFQSFRGCPGNETSNSSFKWHVWRPMKTGFPHYGLNMSAAIDTCYCLLYHSQG